MPRSPSKQIAGLVAKRTCMRRFSDAAYGFSYATPASQGCSSCTEDADVYRPDEVWIRRKTDALGMKPLVARFALNHHLVWYVRHVAHATSAFV